MLKCHFASDSVVADNMSVKSQVDTVKDQLQQLIDLTTESDDYEPDVTTRLKFLAQQISLLFMSQSRYSSDTLLIASVFSLFLRLCTIVCVLLC